MGVNVLDMVNEKQQYLDELKELLQQNVAEVKEQVDALKMQFYRAYQMEKEAALKAAEEAAAEAGEVLENWQPAVDEMEQEFRELLGQYKAKRQEYQQKLEKEMAQNLLRKENILAQMKAMAESETADVMDNLKKMRELQAEWKTIGPVPAPKVQEIWKNYQQYQEQFYDLVKINIELRDLDFKKNLEMKTLLCEAAEKLQNNPSIVEASRALQQLHDEWSEIGPVARELREDLWNRFKEASTVINRKHQAYFDEIHAKEGENLEKKQALLEELKQIDITSITSNKQWEKATQKIQTIQQQWRSIGFAPKKQNQTIYAEYRQLTDAFFKAKTDFFKSMRQDQSENLKQKKEILAAAEELKSSTEWAETTNKLIELQKKWKEVGPVSRKYSEDLWQKFTAACDAFFEAKRQAGKAEKEEVRKNKIERSVAGGDRQKLIRMYENLQQEIKTAENNILFFAGKSKSGNAIVDSLQKKIDGLKKELTKLEEKINALDAE